MTKTLTTRTSGRWSGSETKGKTAGSEAMQNPLHEAFLEEIADMHSAEQQLIKALPKAAKAAQSDELREAIEYHLDETEQHARRIEEALDSLGASMKRKKCKAMAGLIAEADERISDHKGEAGVDAVIISVAQKVEHYEIASYGTLCAWAELMGHREALELFRSNLEEEKAADRKLTEIATTVANPEAAEDQ